MLKQLAPSHTGSVKQRPGVQKSHKSCSSWTSSLFSCLADISCHCESCFPGETPLPLTMCCSPFEGQMRAPWSGPAVVFWQLSERSCAWWWAVNKLSSKCWQHSAESCHSRKFATANLHWYFPASHGCHCETEQLQVKGNWSLPFLRPQKAAQPNNITLWGIMRPWCRLEGQHGGDWEGHQYQQWLGLSLSLSCGCKEPAEQPGQPGRGQGWDVHLPLCTHTTAQTSRTIC